jgi:hypothetical protein
MTVTVPACICYQLQAVNVPNTSTSTYICLLFTVKAGWRFIHSAAPVPLAHAPNTTCNGSCVMVKPCDGAVERLPSHVEQPA